MTKDNEEKSSLQVQLAWMAMSLEIQVYNHLKAFHKYSIWDPNKNGVKMICRLIIRHSEKKLLCSHMEGHNKMEHTYPVIDYCGIFGYS